MRKLIDADLLDIIPTDDGFIYLSRETMPDGAVTGVFHRFSQTDDCFSQASLADYLEAKFGIDGTQHARALGDYITCKVCNLHDGTVFAGYRDGSYKMIREERLTDIDELMYLSSPACSPVSNGRDLWFAVPDVNAVINYSVDHNRVELRIGGPNTKAFCHPVDLSIYDNRLFICNEYSYKIRCLRLDSYTVEDYRVFTEEIKQYFRSGETEYAVLKSGIYML